MAPAFNHQVRRFRYQTVDVFTTRQFGGNPLAVFTDARGMDDAEMQSLASELNYSETTFVLPPEDPANTARIRVFNRTSEMPFAGHPNVGTAYVLATLGRTHDEMLRFEEPAGLVTVRVMRSLSGAICGAEIDAPQALAIGGQCSASAAAACGGLTVDDVIVHSHEPTLVSVGLAFYVVEVTPAALRRATPVVSSFRAMAADIGEAPDRLSIHFYARSPKKNVLHARMFAPLAGTWEDPATGSANAALAAFLLSKGDSSHVTYEINQGAEMGRPSHITVKARRGSEGIVATVGGSCVPVLSGVATLS